MGLLAAVQPLTPPHDAASLHTAATSALRFLLDAGCDVPVLNEHRQWLAAPPVAVAAQMADPGTYAAPAPAPPVSAPRAADPAAPHPALGCDSVEALLALLGRFPDAKKRPPLLFEGALDSGVWVLIDRPDHTPAHRQTIDKMLAAIDLDWSRAALVSRLPWPTPGDGEPTPALLARFTPVLARLAALSPPRHVLALGQLAAEMAGAEARLASSRGRWFAMGADWGLAKLLPSVHPRTMQGNSELRRQALAHLKLFRSELP
jgi:hypothetical protein